MHYNLRVPSGSADVLARALSGARARAVLFARVQLGAPWRLTIPAAEHAGFHIVERGQCWLEPLDGAQGLQLAERDLVLVTNGAGHTLVDDPTSTAAPQNIRALAALPTGELVGGGSGSTTSLVCGGYVLEAAPHQLQRMLPPWVHVRHLEAPRDIRATLELLLAELARPGSGSPTIIARLTDVLLVQALRNWLATAPARQRAPLLALDDGPAGRALATLHMGTGSWSVNMLAQSVGLSAAALRRRISALTGEPTRAHVIRERMELAAHLLRETSAPIAEVGARVGYRSEYAFNRAFRRLHGISPGRYRAQQAQAPAHGLLTTNSQLPSA
ncbi:MAG: AraC family transcriptional regulator [Chloroflexi bacterium]|nr:AraC family transcriptional regulator [Chloroflexota bacterium]